MQPLRITAELAEGVISAIDKSLPIDGPLAWALMRQQSPGKMYSPNYGTGEWTELDMSEILSPVTVDGVTFNACSWAIFEPLKEYIKYRHRRFDTHYAEKYGIVGKKGRKIITAGGTFKTRRIPQVVICTEKITWFCVGDRERIEDLLLGIEYLGSHRAAGFGRVGKWLVKPWPHDWSVYGPDGHLMRAIPSPQGDRVCSVRPPYWTPEKHRCLIPDLPDAVMEDLLS